MQQGILASAAPWPFSQLSVIRSAAL